MPTTASLPKAMSAMADHWPGRYRPAPCRARARCRWIRLQPWRGPSGLRRFSLACRRALVSGRAGTGRPAPSRSRLIELDGRSTLGTDEIHLADRNTGLAQDRVGRRRVEQQVGQDEIQQVGLAFEIEFAGAHLQLDGAR